MWFPISAVHSEGAKKVDFRDDGDAEINFADDIRCEEKSIEYLLSRRKASRNILIVIL